MSYVLASRIRQDRLSKSVAAYEKWIAKNPEATLEDARALLSKQDMKTNSRLYWWALKVYNGYLWTETKTYIWG